MAAHKFIKNVAGTLTEESAVVSSAGVGDEGKLVALDSNGVLDASIVNSIGTSAGAGDVGKLPSLDAAGRLDSTFMPVGIGADTIMITASESLAAGDFVNIWNSTGAKIRKADATSAGKPAHGFVLASVSSSATGTVYLTGQNTGVTGQTPGDVFLLTTAGTAGDTPPTGSGNSVQYIGIALSTTTIDFNPGRPVTLV